MIANVTPARMSGTSTNGIARENRNRVAVTAVALPCKVAIKGINAPNQNATPIACRNTVGAVSRRGLAVLACPLTAKARPAQMSASREKLLPHDADRQSDPRDKATAASASRMVTPKALWVPVTQTFDCESALKGTA